MYLYLCMLWNSTYKKDVRVKRKEGESVSEREDGNDNGDITFLKVIARDMNA